MWQSLSRFARSLVGKSKLVRGGRKFSHRRAIFEPMESRSVLTTLWISGSPQLENAAGGFWLGRSGDASTAVDVHVQLSSAMATAGSDFTARDEMIHLNAGQTQVWVEVEHLDDTVAETVEGYAVLASTNDGLTASGQGWIVDNDGIGSVSADGSLWVTGGSYAENGAAGFWVGRSGDTSATLDVSVAVSGDTATAGSDFTALSSTVHFNPLQSQVWVEVRHMDDATAESTERYAISASASDGRTASGEGWIIDNDGSGLGLGSTSGSPLGAIPSIQNFVCTLNGGNLKVTGMVVDDVDPTGYWVYFGDLLAGRSVQVLADNSFELIIEGWSQHGDISARVTDSTLLTSQIVWDVV